MNLYPECESCDEQLWLAVPVREYDCVDDSSYENSLSSPVSYAWDWVLLGQLSGSGPVWAVCEEPSYETSVAQADGGACDHREPAADTASPRPHKFELADVFRRCAAFVGRLSPHQRRTVGAIVGCRTPAMGTHRRFCEKCGYSEVAANSCRNRHCPKCQGLDEARWLSRQMQDVLPVPYHHVVFTVAQELHIFFRLAPKVAFQLLFTALAETLQEVAARPSNLGARIGFTAILHTWNQRLGFHVHVHCIVPGGGLSEDGERWVSAKPKFLFSVDVLSLVFRAKLLRALELASERGKFPVPKAEAAEARRQAARKPWEVYSKPPMGGPEQVLRYLSRYTHRTAISNSRLVAMEDDRVTFRWHDRSDGNEVKLMTLAAVEFCQRFVQHIVPPGFHRIRHYGLLGNGVRRDAIALCRKRLGEPPRPPRQSAEEPWWELYERVTGRALKKCPRCGGGPLVHELAILAPRRRRWAVPASRPPPRAA